MVACAEISRTITSKEVYPKVECWLLSVSPRKWLSRDSCQYCSMCRSLLWSSNIKSMRLNLHNVCCQGMLETPICASIGNVGEFARLWTSATQPSQVQIHACHTNFVYFFTHLQLNALNPTICLSPKFWFCMRESDLYWCCCAGGCSQWRQERIERRSHCCHLCVCLPCQQTFPRDSLLLPMEEDEQHLRSQTLRFLNCLSFQAKP